MCRALCVLALVAMYVGGAHCWEIAVSVGDEIIFYTHGTRSYSVQLGSRKVAGLAYVEAQNMMLYVDKQDNNDAICGYYLSTMKIECFIKRNGRNIHSLAYDPRTELLFFTDTNEKSINWISLKRGSENNMYNGNLLIKMDDGTPTDIIVDSCNGNIYWSNANNTKNRYLEGARFDGSNRKVLVHFFPLYSLAMDQQIHVIYYIDGCKDCSTRYLNRWYLNGLPYEIAATLSYNYVSAPNELTVSKDNIYWLTNSGNQKTLWEFPKRSVNPKNIDSFDTDQSLSIVANYEKNEGIKGMPDCKLLTNLMPNMTAASDYTDDCSVNEEGLLKCSNNSSSIGEGHEVSACHGYCSNNGECSLNENSEPVCQCKGDYAGDRCEVSDCLNYCLQGNCRFNDEGNPTCSCNAGYIGDRCEVSVCYGYCLNNGECSLNENSEPVCQCKGDYAGDRCEVSDCLNYCLQGNCRFNDEGNPTCSCNAGYIGDRCEVSVCYGYCLNNGKCSLNGNSDPICQCKENYAGDRCEVSDCLNYCLQGNCSFNDEGHPTCCCNAGFIGDRCEVSTCHDYCLNDGFCSLNEDDEAVCECVGNHEGFRCEVDKNNIYTVTNTHKYYSVQENLTLVDLLSKPRRPTVKISVNVEV